MCFPRGAATPDVTIKLKLGDNMFGFCHRKRGGHDCAEARSCGGEGCPISKEMLEAGLISLRRMKEGQKARIAHVQASGELYFIKLLMKADTQISWGQAVTLLDCRAESSESGSQPSGDSGGSGADDQEVVG